MHWREALLRFCGPGVLSGIGLSDWLRLLRQQRRDIDLVYLPRIAAITFQSLKMSALSLVERAKYGPLVEKVVIQPPLFILGHWRSGTTHLHQLLAKDDRFGFPNNYQTAFPRIFLCSESRDSRMVSFFMPKHRPMDNMSMSVDSPQEDEFALCGTCLLSTCMGWVFPRQKDRYKKYLTLKDAEPEEVQKWKDALVHFVRKVQLRCNRPLLLKSPQHTAKIKLLLELFPEARFVHIHRDPFRVFQSTRHSFIKLLRWNQLQRPDLDTLDGLILDQYQEMYEAFFEQKDLIPAGRFHEVAYEQLDSDPVAEMRKLYEALGLPDFKVLEPQLRKYVDSLAGYRKNRFGDLPSPLKERIAEKWKNCFEQWGYEKPMATN